jgi:hypothetical protein
LCSELVAADQRAIGTGGDHAHAGQREFDEEDFISLTAIRAMIAQRFAIGRILMKGQTGGIIRRRGPTSAFALSG